MNKREKYYLIWQYLGAFLFVILCMTNIVQAYEPHKQNTDFSLIISSNNATACNITYIQYPDNSKVILNLNTTKDRTTFYQTISAGNFTQLGIICIGISCSDGITYETGSICRDITINGQGTLNSGQGMSLFGGMLVIILVGVFFFILFFKTKNFGLKVIWIGLAIVDIIIAIMFSMVILTQTLGGNEQLINGFATFFYVIRIFLYILIPAFILFVMYITYKLWNIKRGRQ